MSNRTLTITDQLHAYLTEDVSREPELLRQAGVKSRHARDLLGRLWP